MDLAWQCFMVRLGITAHMGVESTVGSEEETSPGVRITTLCCSSLLIMTYMGVIMVTLMSTNCWLLLHLSTSITCRNCYPALMRHNSSRSIKETGLCKLSIFVGLSQQHSSGLLDCLSINHMHIISINLPDLLLILWQGTLDCNKDLRELWDWAVLIETCGNLTDKM